MESAKESAPPSAGTLDGAEYKNNDSAAGYSQKADDRKAKVAAAREAIIETLLCLPDGMEFPLCDIADFLGHHRRDLESAARALRGEKLVVYRGESHVKFPSGAMERLGGRREAPPRWVQDRIDEHDASLRATTPKPRRKAKGEPLPEEVAKALVAEYEAKRTTLLPSNASFDDVGNGARLARLLAGRHLYVPGNGWLVWDGARWADDAEGLAVLRASTALPSAVADEAKQKEGKDAQAVLTFAAKTAGVDRLGAAIKIARTYPAMHASPSEFDCERHLLNCANGCVDLREGKLLKPASSRRLRHSTGIPFDPRATAPRWARFLHEVTAADHDLIAYIKRLAGYLITGEVRERQFFMLHGVGRNGKDTLLETLLAVLGSYGDRCSPGLFIDGPARDPNAPTPEVARLHGIRLAAASELPRGSKLNEAFLKHITGGDSCTACHKNRPPFTFTPTHKLVVSANHAPSASQDAALWDRLRVIPFRVRFEDDRIDRKLKDTLRTEAAGILAWAVDGAAAYYADGMGIEPEAVRAATSDYRSRENVIGRWMDERCDEGPNARESIGALFKDYIAWADAEAEAWMPKRAFANELDALGYAAHKTNGIRVRVGIQLRRTAATAS